MVFLTHKTRSQAPFLCQNCAGFYKIHIAQYGWRYSNSFLQKQHPALLSWASALGGRSVQGKTLKSATRFFSHHLFSPLALFHRPLKTALWTMSLIRWCGPAPRSTHTGSFTRRRRGVVVVVWKYPKTHTRSSSNSNLVTFPTFSYPSCSHK